MSVEFRWVSGLYSKLYMHTWSMSAGARLLPAVERPYSIQSFSIGQYAGLTVAYRGNERLGFFNTPDEAKRAAETTYLLGEQ